MAKVYVTLLLFLLYNANSKVDLWPQYIYINRYPGSCIRNCMYSVYIE